jgi:A/G-specific adenine glycosylase
MNGKIPDTMDELINLPGIGPGTAGAVMAYAFCKPETFIETNIRTVFIHFFFYDHDKVDDKQLLPLIEKTLDNTDPRNWYYALTDYGVAVKAAYPNPSRKSRHHTKQSKFEGSDRQIRGKILELLIQNNSLNMPELYAFFGSQPTDRINRITCKMVTEGMITRTNTILSIPA